MADANPWWVLQESTGQAAYFQATPAAAAARAKLAITYGGERALYGPYATKADAQAAVASGAAKPQNPSPPPSVPGVPGLTQIGQFFSDLGQRNTWLRVAKVVGGIALIIIGVAHLVHAGNIITTAAKAVPA